jgi:hypothetical protein
MGYDSSGNYVPGSSVATDKYGTSYTGHSSRNNEDPGWLGTDVFKGDVYLPNAGSYANPDDAKNHDLLAQYFNSLGGRTAPTATAASAGSATMAGAANAGPGVTYGGATIDTTGSNEARGYQMGLMNQLQAQATGKAPSLAEATMKQGLAANLQQQAGLAGTSGGGSNPALAMRNLQMGAAQQNQQMIGQAGLARLQEQLAAEQQLGGLSSNVRGQDIGLAEQQAGLTQQAGMFSAGQQNQFALANAGFAQQAGLANAAAQNQYGLANAGFEQQAALANQQSQLGLMDMTQQGQMGVLGQQIGMSEADRQAAMDYEQLMGQQSLGANQLAFQAYNAGAQGRAKFAGGLMTGFAGLSDRRTKVGVVKEGYTLSPIDEKTDIAFEGGGHGETDQPTPDYSGARFGNFMQGFGSSIAGTTPTFTNVPSPFASDPTTMGGGEPSIDQFVATDRAGYASRLGAERAQMDQWNAAQSAQGQGGGGMSLSGLSGMMGGFGGGGGDVGLSPIEQKKQIVPESLKYPPDEFIDKPGDDVPEADPNAEFLNDDEDPSGEGVTDPGFDESKGESSATPEDLKKFDKDIELSHILNGPYATVPKGATDPDALAMIQAELAQHDREAYPGMGAALPGPSAKMNAYASAVADKGRKSRADRAKFYANLLSQPQKNTKGPSDNETDGSFAVGNGLGRLGGAGAMAALSDEKAKESVTASGKGASRGLLDPLTAYSYRYKDPSLPGAAPGRQLGVMAQDLERSPYAMDAVIETPNGKMVNYAKLAPPMLAAEADLNKRVSLLEQTLGKRKKKVA